MDHHCPWINSCVGIKNQKFFILFLFYVMLGCIYGMCVIVTYRLHCITYFCREMRNPLTLIAAVVGIFLDLLFGLFTIVMLFDQLTCILWDNSTIDKLNKKRGKKESELEREVSKWQRLKNVFGGRVSLSWLVPTDVRIDLTIESQY